MSHRDMLQEPGGAPRPARRGTHGAGRAYNNSQPDLAVGKLLDQPRMNDLFAGAGRNSRSTHLSTLPALSANMFEGKAAIDCSFPGNGSFQAVLR